MPHTTLRATVCALLAAGAAAAPAQAATNSHVDLRDAGGVSLTAFDCRWEQGAPDGRDCRAVLGDPVDELALLRRAGADSAHVRIWSDDGRYLVTHTFSARADGTWLMRGTDHLAGRSFGFVCEADGSPCVPWRSATTSARSAVAKAARTLRRR